MTDDFARTLRARADAVPDVVAVSTADVLEGVRRRRRARRARRSAGAAALVVAVGAGVWTWGGQPAAPEVALAEEGPTTGAAHEVDAAEAPVAERLSATDEEPEELPASETYAADAATTSLLAAGLERTCDEHSRVALAAVDRFLPPSLTAATGLETLLRVCLS